MAFTKRNTSVVCLAALIVVMATMMLSCDAGDYCFDIPGPCVQSLCKDACAKKNYPNRPRCQPVTDECCCDTAAKPDVGDAIRHD
uniref:Uncharacterized protein n=1 Tax=Hordeum vulgare subsp. vulgare TaxID=112509 RepID=A0A8I6WLY3_HORVV